MINLDSFKAYDIRGRIPDETQRDRSPIEIGRAYASFVKPQARGGRPRHPPLQPAARRRAEPRPDATAASTSSTSACAAPRASYFATFAEQLRRRHHGHRQPQSARLQRHEVRARAESRPISADTGLQDMRRADRERAAARPRPRRPAACSPLDIHAKYLEHLLSYVDVAKLQAAEGGGERRQRRRRAHRRPARAAPAVRVHQGQPRAGRHFPERRAQSRCCEENRAATTDAVRRTRRRHRPGLGRRLRPLLLLRRAAAQFIEGYYLVGLLAEAFLQAASRARASCTTRA